MKKILVVWLAALFGFMAAPAFAEVNLTVTVNKTKDLIIVENIDEFWDIDFIVVPVVVTDAGAEAQAIANIENTSNTVSVILDDALDEVSLIATIESSITNNSGEVQFNQDVGNNVNQGNVLMLKKQHQNVMARKNVLPLENVVNNIYL